MIRVDTARTRLQDALNAVDIFMSTDRATNADPIEINLLRKFRHQLVAMLDSIEGQAIRNPVPDSGMGHAIVDHWPIPENSPADVELNTVVRKVMEADGAYYRAVK